MLWTISFPLVTLIIETVYGRPDFIYKCKAHRNVMGLRSINDSIIIIIIIIIISTWSCTVQLNYHT